MKVFGGLGLFLYGMFKMGDGLRDAAGDRLRKILEALTTNRFLGLIVGVVVTLFIQASAATAVMLVGFVNAGLMSLEQAITVLMGANIGTTITAQLVAFRFERLALPAVGLGMFLRFFAKKNSQKGLVDAFLGFGILFLGITIMGQELGFLKTYEPFVNLMLSSAKNPLLGVLFGFIFTAIIQSSSVTTGLLVMLASQGLITLAAAIPVIFGANIGTTTTALLAAAGANLTAKRTALAHFLINLLGTLALLPFVGTFEAVVLKTSPVVSRQIANAHTLFNVVVSLALFPFVNRFAFFVKKILVGEETIVERGPKFLDERLIATPFMAVPQTKKEVVRMGRMCQENLSAAVEEFFETKKADRRRFLDTEDVIHELEEAISSYVSRLSQVGVRQDESLLLTSMINVATDVERIGDHATSIMEMSDYKEEHKLVFSEEALAELDSMIQKVLEILEMAITCLEEDDYETATTLVRVDDVIDDLEKDLRNQHIRRLNQGKCYPGAGVIYLELLTHLERVGDHSVNIGDAVIAGRRRV